VSITVVSELAIRPGHENAIMDIAQGQLALPSSSVVGRRFARLFQGLEDPTRLLYVADWESPEAYDAYARGMPMPGRPEQYVQPPTRRYFRSLTAFERVLAPIGVASAVIVDGPAETHVFRRDLGLAFQQVVIHDRPGLVLLTLYEAVEPPAGLLMLAGWESVQAFEEAFATAQPKLVDQLVQAGGVARRFLGRVFAESPRG